ncbi:MAG: hypothetical protein IIA33_06380, partial [Planctomycetes bacterium]|nr:hypothetical protein [Planctomycetota bacterium]
MNFQLFLLAAVSVLLNSVAGAGGQGPKACGDPAAGDCFHDNGSLGCNDTDCCVLVCNLDPFCCDIAWDQVCADLAVENCAGGPTGSCCLTDASCIDGLTVIECSAAGGIHEGEGTLCGQVDCVHQVIYETEDPFGGTFGLWGADVFADQSVAARFTPGGNYTLDRV